MTLYLGENLIAGVTTVTDKSERIGQIIQSTIPLTDAGLHLLDGSLVSGSGSYSAFVDYIADLWGEEEATWVQPTLTSNTSYGVVSSTSIFSDSGPYFAFNGVVGLGDKYLSNSTSGGDITWELPINIKISSFRTYQTEESSYLNRFPTTITLQGSTDGSTWDTVGTASGYSQPSSGGYIDVTVTNPDYYKYYKWVFGANFGGNSGVAVSEISINATYIKLNDCFCTEAEWQQSVTNYGACDKYVYDDVNNTVRIPKRTTEHGELIKSYSSGTEWYRVYSDSWCEQGGVCGNGATVSLLRPYKDTNYSITFSIRNGESWGGANYMGCKCTNINASSFYIQIKGGDLTAPSLSWQTSGYVDISDYQYSPIYEYIVIATTTKTEIEVDIDEVATDLNGKADVDLSNINNSCKPIDGQWIGSNSLLTQATATGTYQLDLSNYLPNDAYNYEVLFVAYIYSANSGDTNYRFYNDIITDEDAIWGYVNASARCVSNTFVFPISAQRYISLVIYGNAASTVKIRAKAYRRIGTNQ